MIPHPSRTTVAPEAGASDTLTQLVTGAGATQVELLGLKSGKPYQCSFRDKHGRWYLKNEELTNTGNQTYDALVVGETNNRLEVMGLSTTGVPYQPCYQDSNGKWNDGRNVPNAGSHTYSALVTGVGHRDRMVVVGLTTEGMPYLPCYQLEDGSWKGGNSITSLNQKYKALVIGKGGNKDDNLQVVGLTTDDVPHWPCYQERNTGGWRNGGALPSLNQKYTALVTGMGTNGKLQVVGLTTKGEPYLPCHQESASTWVEGRSLPNPGSKKYSALVTGMGTNGKLQVVGLTTENKPYRVCQHETGAEWLEGGEFPNTQSHKLSALVTARGADNVLLVLGLGTDNHPYLIAWQDTGGAWHPGLPLDNATPWIGVGRKSFSPDTVGISGGQGVAFYLMDRGAETTVKVMDKEALFKDGNSLTVLAGGVSYQRLSDSPGKLTYVISAEVLSDGASAASKGGGANDSMQGSINVVKGR